MCLLGRASTPAHRPSRWFQVVTVVDTRQPAPGGTEGAGLNPAGTRVTLGAVGEPQDLDLFMLNAAEWAGPKVGICIP